MRPPIDKSTWPPGPWHTEGDSHEWTDSVTGYQCTVLRMPWGNLCGYVDVPRGHPLHGKSYSDTLSLRDFGSLLNRPTGSASPIDVFLQAARPNQDEAALGILCDVHGGLTYSRANGEAWRFGFDCGHYGDYQPGRRDPSPGTYRDLGYVIAECDSLARQLRDISFTILATLHPPLYVEP